MGARVSGARCVEAANRSGETVGELRVETAALSAAWMRGSGMRARQDYGGGINKDGTVPMWRTKKKKKKVLLGGQGRDNAKRQGAPCPRPR